MSASKQPPEFSTGNTQLAFSTPWEAHAFALIVKLHEQGCLNWTEWSRTLADTIANSSATDQQADSAAYYRDWLEALEKLLIAKNIVSHKELVDRQEELNRG